MAEKFLVLGASSFYGSNFIKYVESKGDHAAPWPYRLEERPIGKFYGLDYVVNFASRNLVAESWADPTGYAKTNVVDTTALVELLKDSGIKKFVHVSTPESYGHTEGWVDETYATWSPSTPYGVSRAAMDMMLMAYHKATKFPVVITRTANIYGIGQPKHRLVPLVVDKLRNGQKVQLHGGGNTLRCFVHVQDACAATYLAVKQGSPGQTYHISSTTPVTVANVVNNLCSIMGKSYASSVEAVPDRPGKDGAYLLKSERLRVMGWRETYTLERGLSECASVP